MATVIAKTESFCICGVQISRGQQVEMRRGIAVHVECRDKSPNAESEASTWTLTAAPAPQPKKPGRFAPVSLDGPTRNDAPRLVGQLRRTYELMSRGQWWTLTALAQQLEYLETSAGARLRDLRKREHGGHTVLCRPRADGSGEREYRLVVVTSKTNGAADAA